MLNKTMNPSPGSSNSLVVLLFFGICFSLCIVPSLTTWTRKTYCQARQDIIKNDHQSYFDKQQPSLNAKEKKVEQLLQSLISEETFNMNRYTHGKFFLAESFYKMKDIIERDSKLLPFIFDIPKGGIQHLHLDSFGDMRWFVRNVTYDDNCYIYLTNNKNSKVLNGTMRLYGSPSMVPKGYQKVNTLRNQYKYGVKAFDEELHDLLSLSVETGDPEQAADEVWTHFNNCIFRVDSALYNVGVYKKYLIHNMEQAIEKDNVQYLEFRESLTPLYDLSGNKYNISDKIEVFIEAVKTVQTKYPFFSSRLILFGVKVESKQIIRQKAWTTLEMVHKYPGWVMGFDLVGEEDKTHQLEYYLEDLIQTSNAGLKFWFHAGESNNYTNANLYDAILLKSQRIGHGYIGYRHPDLMQMESNRKIALEICPLSNKILGLVGDLRDHPFGAFIHHHLQPSVNSDDPGVFGYTFVSWDWYSLIVSFGLDLQDIKQLAQNAIQYSGMTSDEKDHALDTWQKQWDIFINKYSQF
eukprot:gb/GECH01011573.1/.p1 GENE.gb/GECH01011573.1/~~gb/GECH01011573.1/.p1  ORF type:complete len:522 (+),score=122.01 gb/GECH01011573.1/:1-1566(+)